MSTLRVSAINNPSASSGGLAISAAGNVTGTGLDLIASVNATGVSNIIISNCFTSSYQNYRLIITNVLTSNAAATDINMRLRSGTTSSSGSHYYAARTYSEMVSGGSLSAVGYAALTAWTLAQQNSGFSNGIFTSACDILRPAEIWPTFLHHVGSGQGGGNWYQITGVHGQNQYVAYDSLDIFPQSGNISATVRLYGYRN